ILAPPFALSFYSPVPHFILLSFPTRRSSDLNRDAGILCPTHFRVPSDMILRERYLQNTRLLSFESVAVVFGECSARFYYLPYPVFSFQNHQSGNHHLLAGGGSFFLQIPQSKLNRKEN